MKLSLFKVILLGVFGFAAVIGLFVFATHTGSKTSSTDVGPVTIWGTLPKASIQDTLITLAQTDAAYKSVSYVEKDPATLPTELASAIATGNAPDLVLDSQENLLALRKYITTIPSAQLSQSTFTNAFIGAANILQAPDGYYGIPFLVDPLALFSNRSILASAGVAESPSTWESLAGLVPRIATLTSSRQITRGLIGLGTYSNVHNASGILSALLLQQQVPISMYNSGGILGADLGTATQNGVSPGTAVLAFYTQFADPSKLSYTWNLSLPDSRQAFLQGDVALYLGYISEARYFQNANPNLDFGVSILPQPGLATVKSTYGRLYSFIIPHGAKNSAGAYTVAVEFTTSASQKALAQSTGLAPVMRAELANPPAEAVASVAYSEALYTHVWLSTTAASTDTVFSAMIGNVISGRLTRDTALTAAEHTLSTLLQP